MNCKGYPKKDKSCLVLRPIVYKEGTALLDTREGSYKSPQSQVRIPEGCLICKGNLITGLEESLDGMYAEVHFGKPTKGSVIQGVLHEIGRENCLDLVRQDRLDFRGSSIKSCPSYLPPNPQDSSNIVGYVSPYLSQNLAIRGPDGYSTYNDRTYRWIEIAYCPWHELNIEKLGHNILSDTHIANSIKSLGNKIAKKVDCRNY